MVDSSLASQAFLAAALVGVGVVAARFLPSSTSTSSTTSTSAQEAASTTAKKANKKRKKPAGKGVAPSDGSNLASSVDNSRAPTPLPAAEPPAPTPTPATAPVTAAKQKGGKKKVEKAASSQPKPLAERRAPKARKTGVEDMLDDEEDEDETPARVIKVVEKPKPPPPPPANAYIAPSVDRDEWESYENIEDEGEWEAVDSKAKRTVPGAVKSLPTVQAPSRPSIPGLPSASAQGKKNAKKAAAASDAKADAERDRLERLAAHRAGRAAEDAKAQAVAARPKPTSVNSAPKSSDDYWNPRVSKSTATASISDTGSLIWG